MYPNRVRHQAVQWKYFFIFKLNKRQKTPRLTRGSGYGGEGELVAWGGDLGPCQGPVSGYSGVASRGSAVLGGVHVFAADGGRIWTPLGVHQGRQAIVQGYPMPYGSGILAHGFQAPLNLGGVSVAECGRGVERERPEFLDLVKHDVSPQSYNGRGFRLAGLRP